jgi:hypothetical protein
MDEVKKRPHINADGEFQSDKYDWCKPGFVPLKTSDPMAQDLLWTYAQRRMSVDVEFKDDLHFALEAKGFKQPEFRVKVEGDGLFTSSMFIPWNTEGIVIGVRESREGFWRRRVLRILVKFDHVVSEGQVENDVTVAVLPSQVAIIYR